MARKQKSASSDTDQNPHAGHRGRLRNRYLQEGLDGFEDHNVLELLLFFCVVKQDTNVIAHALLDRFGSFSGVLNADVDSLFAVKGMTHNAALLLHLLPAVFRRYGDDQVRLEKELNTSEKIGDYLLPKYIGRTSEAIYLLCLDPNCRLLCCELLSEGGTNDATIDVRKIAELAFRSKASHVVLAHNHPNGEPKPTFKDINTTRTVQATLKQLGIELVDHFIIAKGEAKSMMELGYLGVQSILEIDLR